MIVLGVHGGTNFEHEDDVAGFVSHDSAAVLVRDGEVVAAIEEERLNRIKHSNAYPVRAIEACLKIANCTLDEVDIIATNQSASLYEYQAKIRFLRDSQFDALFDGRAFYAKRFLDAFGIDVRAKLRFFKHHMAHAWSAWLSSGFDECLVVVLDGDGEDASGMIAHARNDIKILHEFQVTQSLGHLYETLILFVGYERFDEYKVMGLAPYGDPRAFRGIFSSCYSLLPDGQYKLAPSFQWFEKLAKTGLLGKARRKGAEFSQIHKDFAAALQEALEVIVLHVLKHYRNLTGQRHLCLAGGVALNCSMNGVILRSGLFDEIFVQPAAHDAGGAMGAAMAAYRAHAGLPSPTRQTSVSWGTEVGNCSSIVQVLERWRRFVDYRIVENAADEAAALLADGHVIGWVQGRAEFGPRALGYRSILADPRPAENKRRINAMIKKREAYRPFAPSVPEEHLAEYFSAPASQGSFPFMIFVLPVREDKRDLLGAVTHVDGTARVHSVSRTSNPKYWQLIQRFGEHTGVPVVLNTSFNNHAEPIVDSVEDAVQCFLTTDLNYLVVGDCVVSKKAAEPRSHLLLSLAPRVAPTHKLTARTLPDGLQKTYAVESAKGRWFGTTRMEISVALHTLLQASDGREPLSSLLAASPPIVYDVDTLSEELFELWQNRMVRVTAT
jgi:carbamoyltransferase